MFISNYINDVRGILEITFAVAERESAGGVGRQFGTHSTEAERVFRRRRCVADTQPGLQINHI